MPFKCIFKSFLKNVKWNEKLEHSKHLDSPQRYIDFIMGISLLSSPEEDFDEFGLQTVVLKR